MPKDEQQVHGCFGGSREFKLKYSGGSSTQALWRDKGMPHYRVPNSRKILYKFEEIDAWLASGKVVGENHD